MILLIADDEPSVRSNLETLFSKEHQCLICADGLEALAQLKKTCVDLVITDQQMPGLTGLEVIRKGKEISPSTAFILMTAYGTVAQAVEAIQLGADDYILKPFQLTEMAHRIQKIGELRHWRDEAALRSQSLSGTDRIIGCSEAINRVKAFVHQVSPISSPVLLLGESGTGKEVVARAIHECSPRGKHPFVPINCASLSEPLMDSELFGHEKGAFTGAVSTKPGKFELAKSGTLFLDEIGELSPALQAKLLRVLQEKEYFRVGGVQQIRTDARVIAATHRNLPEMVKQGRFREDLFFRLNVLSIELTPLRRRPEDIPLLVDLFWQKMCRDLDKQLQLSDTARENLLRYSYPGNVRELQNTIERLIVLGSPFASVEPLALPSEYGAGHVPSSPIPPKLDLTLSFEELLDAFERRILVEALHATKGNQKAAGKMLKLSRGALQYKLKKHGLTSADDEKDAA